MYSQEVQLKLLEFRNLARSNQLTPEQAREALNLLRGDRKAASTTSNAAKTKKAASKVPVNGDDLLRELDGL